MAARRINPLALMLGIVTVLGIGSMMVTMTDPWSPAEMKSSREALKTLDVGGPPPAMPMPPPAMPSRIEYQPGTVGAANPPGISPTAAPGVAFTYRYAFRLAGDRIARVQEQHAAACERLGGARCRITGMRFRVGEAGAVDAMLALKLEPAIARRFGRSGAEAVARAEGQLLDAEISGTDSEAPIRAASRGIAELQDDLQRLETRLAGRLSNEERVRLEDEARQLRLSIRAAESSRDEHREALASTPMLFEYASAAPAVAQGRPEIGPAVERAAGIFIVGLSMLLIVAVTLLPWLLLGGLLWWLLRALKRRFGWHSPEPAGQPA